MTEKAPLLTVDKSEFEKAKQYFSENPTEVKYSRKDSGSKHSFLKVEGKLYAMQKAEYLGQGAFGKVKVAQDEYGNAYAVKIEGKGITAEDAAEQTIMSMLGRFVGQIERKLKTPITFLKRETQQKKYTLQQLVSGKEMRKHLDEAEDEAEDEKWNKNAELTSLAFTKGADKEYKNLYASIALQETQKPKTKLVIAIKALESIQALHARGIIHSDIKPANFMINLNGDQITVASIDFGLSLKLNLKQGETQINSASGSPYYMAPEIAIFNKKGEAIEVKGITSFASDIYALGVMLNNDFKLHLSSPLIKKMTSENPEDRPRLSDVIEQCYKELAVMPNLSANENKLIEQYNNEKLAMDKLQQAHMKKLCSLTEADIQRQAGQLKESKAGVGSWAFGGFSQIGRTISGPLRAQQQQSLAAFLKTLDSHEPKLTASDKALLLYGFYTEMERAIKQEYYIKTPGLLLLCQNQKSELEQIFPQVFYVNNRQRSEETALPIYLQFKETLETTPGPENKR